MAKLQSAGPKACAQCGTTRTPQWREGPEGPKTLCNACGVKRVRSMRTGQDAAPAKRKAPIQSRQQGPAAKRPSTASHRSILTQAVTDLYPAAAASPSKRMKRAAAVKAASRAHEFASTGTWPDDDVACTIPIASVSSEPETPEDPSSVQHSKDDPHSDSADEEVWGPRPHPADEALPAGVVIGLPTALTKQVGESSTAAIGLLAMSIPEEKVQKSSRFAPANARHVSTGHPALAEPVLGIHQPSGLEHAGMYPSALCPIKASFERMCWAKRALPRDKSPQFKRLLQKAAKAYCSAIEAEGPVLEMARLLAAKQAALSKSLADALQANNELEEYIHRHEQPSDSQPPNSRGATRRSGLV